MGLNHAAYCFKMERVGEKLVVSHLKVCEEEMICQHHLMKD